MGNRSVATSRFQSPLGFGWVVPLARSREAQFILGACGRILDPDRLRDLVHSRPRWDAVLRESDRLGLTPLLHARLSPLASKVGMPPEFMARLAERYYEWATENARMYENARDVLTAFHGEGIPTIVLKGAALAEPVYGNIAARPMQDLDLLVRPEHLDVADRILRELGYAPDESYRPAEWYRRHLHHLAPYVSFERRSNLELHHHLLPPSVSIDIPMRDLWDRACPARIASTQALMLAPPDFLLHLCLHVSAVDRFLGGLRGLCDIGQVTGRWEKDLDWARLLRSAREYGVGQYVYYTLSLAERFVAAGIPEGVLRTLESMGRVGVLQDRALKALIPGLALAHQASASMVPPWLIADACAELLTRKPRRQKALALVRRFYGGLIRSTRARHPRLGLLALPYAVLVRPFTRAFGALRRLFSSTEDGQPARP